MWMSGSRVRDRVLEDHVRELDDRSLVRLVVGDEKRPFGRLFILDDRDRDVSVFAGVDPVEELRDRMDRGIAVVDPLLEHTRRGDGQNRNPARREPDRLLGPHVTWIGRADHQVTIIGIERKDVVLPSDRNRHECRRLWIDRLGIGDLEPEPVCDRQRHLGVGQIAVLHDGVPGLRRGSAWRDLERFEVRQRARPGHLLDPMGVASHATWPTKTSCG